MTKVVKQSIYTPKETLSAAHVLPDTQFWLDLDLKFKLLSK